MIYTQKKIYVFALFIMLFGIFYCKTEENKVEQADKNSQSQEVHPQPEEINPPPDVDVGKYSEIPIDCDEAVQAYSFLQSELSHTHPEIRLLSVEKAMFQVAAGYNVILYCTYTVEGQNKPAVLRAKIYVAPEEKMHLKKMNLHTTGKAGDM
jgi:hypothetical protein